MEIVGADVADARVAAMLADYIASIRRQTAHTAHLLDLAAYRPPAVTLFAAWEGESLLGIAALRMLAPDHGELKSMHTAPAARRRGVGSALLRHIVGEARARGMTRLSLETGSWDHFRPAVALYRRFGFVDCPPYRDAATDPRNLFMTLDLGGN